jgi:hypothetical protein
VRSGDCPALLNQTPPEPASAIVDPRLGRIKCVGPIPNHTQYFDVIPVLLSADDSLLSLLCCHVDVLVQYAITSPSSPSQLALRQRVWLSADLLRLRNIHRSLQFVYK